MADMKALVEEIAKALVEDQSQVEVRQTVNGPATVLELRVGPSDLGRVIGRQGRTARSIRAVLAAASFKAHQRVTLDIVEPGGNGR